MNAARMRYLALSLLLVACGPPDFAGRYKGTFDSAGSCSDGSRGVSLKDALWIVTDNAGDISVATFGGTSCTTLRATAQGNIATLASRTCPSFGDATITIQDTVRSGGTLTLNGSNLKVAFSVFAALFYPDGTRGSCDDSLSGILLLQP